MSKILQDIWIMKETGIVLFSRVFDPQLDDQLFGGLMSALNSFANELTDADISNFVLKKKRFAVLKLHNLLFVANAEKKVKEKKLEEEVQKISGKFFDMFPVNRIENWNYDVNEFLCFEEEIKDNLQERLQNFWVGYKK